MKKDILLAKTLKPTNLNHPTRNPFLRRLLYKPRRLELALILSESLGLVSTISRVIETSRLRVSPTSAQFHKTKKSYTLTNNKSHPLFCIILVAIPPFLFSSRLLRLLFLIDLSLFLFPFSLNYSLNFPLYYSHEFISSVAGLDFVSLFPTRVHR